MLSQGAILNKRAFANTGIFCFFSLLLIFAVTGCVTYFPVEEYTYARAALEAARDAEASKYAPSLWYKAESAYNKAEREYKERSYDDAKDSFNEAKFAAERAENAARLARFQSGDTSPP